MDKYYYLTAQLPTLLFAKEAGLSIASYLQEAKKWLSAQEYALLDRMVLDDKISGNAQDPLVLRQYGEFDRDLRNDLAQWRQGQTTGQEYKPQYFSASAVREHHPLDAEISLLQLRWDFIESLEIDHYFDVPFLILYCLKLQILQRLFAFDRERGLANFQERCEVKL